ncbi:MAG: hypothetical protein Q8O92_15410 [Candidatus Latescibacter sp.]|nr:hypothetical protein [Candidatus Latescibacter sp.]
MLSEPTRKIVVPASSPLSEDDYREFLLRAYRLFARFPQYFAPDETIDALELAHVIPSVPETIISIYVGINDAVCNKGLITPFLVRHSHNSVFVFDTQVYSGGSDAPSGTVDAREMLTGFEPPNSTWNPGWTYIMIQDPARTPASLWNERGYIDMIAAKFEDFTLLSDEEKSGVCFFIDEKAFDHPVNRGREYLKEARRRGDKMAHEFVIPKDLEGETEGLAPVILRRGEKLYVATIDFRPCAHAWSNIHPGNEDYAVVNENSAVPLDLIVAKPPVNPKYSAGLIPARGSADLTTDAFFRGRRVIRQPILQGKVRG